MTLARTRDLMTAAQRDATALYAFNVVGLEHGEAIVAAADDAAKPVILQISENTATYHGGLRPLGYACLAIAESASVEVSVHLDHATAEELCATAMDMGFSSVMFDASAQPFETNVQSTADLVAAAHARDVFVEAELGEIGGKGGLHAANARTCPDQAMDFVRRTGVDALAVAVGSSHAMVEQTAVLDLELTARLRQSLSVPLVLHGSSGVSPQALAEAVHAGFTKLNIGTALNTAMTCGVRTTLDSEPEINDPRRYLGAGRDAIRAAVAQLLDGPP